MKKLICSLFAFCMTFSLMAQDLSDVRIYINPGHGGYGGDDRGITVYPYAKNDTAGFWESSSNLSKGLMLDTLLRNYGCTTAISRTLNREADDLDLSVIVAQANAFNADFMLSIHSNAGVNNYVVLFYPGREDTDHATYPTPTPTQDESKAIATRIVNLLGENQITVWGYPTPRAMADKTWCAHAFGWSDGYGVLRGLTVPGCISEGSMHDYIPETYRLLNVNYRYIESWHFFEAFCEHFNAGAIDHGIVGGCLRDSEVEITFPEFYYIKGSRDAKNPLCGAWVYLLKDNVVVDSCQTDQLYNGVYLFKNVKAGEYVVRAKAEGHYDKEVALTVEAGKVNYLNFLMDMYRSTPPEVVSYVPNVAINDSVECSQQVVINFNWDMRAEATMNAFTISPAVEGTLSMENSNKTLRFKPAIAFDKATTYTVTLSTEACHPDTNFQNHLEKPFSFQFTTKNRSNLSITMSYPAPDAVDVPLNPSFILIFDQPLKSSSNAKANFALQDMNGKAVTINSRTLSIKGSVPAPYGYASFNLAKELAPATQYKLIVKPELLDVNDIPHIYQTEIVFTTADNQSITDPVVIDMDAAAFIFNTEKSLFAKSGSVLRNTTNKLFGQAANELIYTFVDGEKNAEVAYDAVDPSAVIVNTNCRLGMYVLGNYSGNELWAELNCEGDIKYAKICTMDYAGWKYQTADLTTLVPGLNFQLTGLKIVHNEGLLSQSGSIFVDDITSVYTAPSALNDAIRMWQPGIAFDLLGRPVNASVKHQIVILDGHKQLR